MSKVESQVEDIVFELLKQFTDEYELVDVEYVKEKDYYLRVYIDKNGGLDLEDCQKISDELGKILDEKNIIRDSYYLEVSSPGLDRQLKKPKDFIREQGKKVEVKFYAPIENQKSIIGTLKDFDEKYLILEKCEPIPFEKISSVRLYIEF